MWWRLAQVAALVVLAFWAGAFALYVFPGTADTERQQTVVEPTPYVAPCDRLREVMWVEEAFSERWLDASVRLGWLRCVEDTQTIDCPRCPDCSCECGY